MTRRNYAKDNSIRSGEGFIGDPNKGGSGDVRPAFRGFVNPSFSDSDKATFEGWLAEPDLYFAALNESVALGWQYTLKRDDKNKCFVTTASNWDGANQNAGWILPLRAGDPARSLAKAVWALTHFYGYQIHNRGLGERDGEMW